MKTTTPNDPVQAAAEARRRPLSQVGQVGATVWFTGLSGSGKSTLAAALVAELTAAARIAYRLDGDELRRGLNSNLGFSPEHRSENIRRTSEVARLFADCGVIAVVSLISPYAADRQLARTIHQAQGLRFFEVFVDCPLAVAEARDPKGLYARARAGGLPGFTGIDAPYEAPIAPDLRLSTADTDVPACLAALKAMLQAAGVC